MDGDWIVLGHSWLWLPELLKLVWGYHVPKA